MKEEEILETARKRFKLVNDTEAAQRKREIDDLAFQVPENQWSAEAREQRKGGSVEGVNISLPARPCLSIPKLHQPIQIVLNQERSSRLGVNVHPLNEQSSKETAETLQGLYRRIERDSNAHQARSWAFQRAVEAGRGAYRVNLAHDEDSDYPFDLEIRIERILHQQNVFFDPSAQLADWSDGEWAFNVAWMPEDVFKRQFPKAKLSSSDSLEWAGINQEAPEWVKGEGPDKAFLIAEYFYKEYEEQRVVLVERLADGDVKHFEVDKNWKPQDGMSVILRERDIKKPIVKWCKMCGLEVLPDTLRDWDGKYIPLVPVVGRELIPFSPERIWTGVIGPAKDAQRTFNYGASSLVEMAALEPRAPFVGDPKQFEGYERW